MCGKLIQPLILEVDSKGKGYGGSLSDWLICKCQRMQLRDILNSAMNSFSGIQPCHPEEYLLHDSSRFLKDERTQQVVRTMETAALVNNDQLNLERLFETGGVFVISNNGKKRRLKKQLSDSSPSTK